VPKPKKSDSFGVRFDPELRSELEKAAGASDMTSAEALRLAAKAMITAYAKYGRIPKDMEIRQAHIGDMLDLNELLSRVQAVAEGQAVYHALPQPKKPPGRPSPKEGGTGPVVLVSDRPA
jgi:hypothetical protein